MDMAGVVQEDQDHLPRQMQHTAKTHELTELQRGVTQLLQHNSNTK